MDEPTPLIEPDEDYGRRRILANARRVARERKIRWTLRVVIVIGAAPLVLAIIAGERFPEWLWTVAIFGLLIALVAGGFLFMMGGIAPMSVRRHLSERERRLLDD